jgi:pimeloyl-ACP methyl ester carboxylesterase
MKLVRVGLLLFSCLTLTAQTPPQDHFFDSGDVRIRFVDLGRGEPVVLVHGFTSNVESWNRGDILQSLSHNYRVIALDLRGHGKSGKPRDPEKYGIDAALDVLRLMDHLGIHRAHVVGYSMGARVTAYLLANHPDRFITATLGGSAPIPGLQVTKEGIEAVRKRSLTQADSDPQDYAALAASLEAARVRELPTYEQLGAVDVPVLAITGSEDSKQNVDGLKALKSVIRSYKLVVIEGARHGTQTVSSPIFLESLAAFLASHTAKD